ncbi:MAG: hypothetical protein NTZ26_06645 [Candidatus Aminicenantes bacterium]|nr:hypothetical protein [Candidatus Aminicenantes bacterium]
MKSAFYLLLIGFVVLLAACGGKKAPADDQAATAKPQTPTAQAAVVPAADNEGVLLAKEILGLFDEAVAEAAGLTKDKPEAAALKPKLDALYEKYAAKMAEINPRFLALKAKDIALFGAANGYLGENRGKHDLAKDNTLSDAYRYYNLEKGEKEIVDFLAHKLPALIDIAVKM